MITLADVTLTGNKQAIHSGLSVDVYDRLVIANNSPDLLVIRCGTVLLKLEPFTIDILQLEASWFTVDAIPNFSTQVSATLGLQAVRKDEEIGTYPQPTGGTAGDPAARPNKRPISNGYATGTDVVVIVGVVGQTIYLFTVVLAIRVAAAGLVLFISDGSGAAPPIYRVPTGVVGAYLMNCFGAPLTPGNGVFVTVPAAVTADVTIVYSQA